jgi:hypothetical protein
MRAEQVFQLVVRAKRRQEARHGMGCRNIDQLCSLHTQLVGERLYLKNAATRAADGTVAGADERSAEAQTYSYQQHRWWL